MQLRRFSLLLSCCASVWAVPMPSPESIGAGGECFDPEITVGSVEKVKQGPYLVTGARADANPGGGTASFSKTYTVSTTVTGGLGLDLSGDRDFTKIFTLGLGLNPSFSISKTTGTAVAAIAGCPANKDYNYTITWGLQDYQYQWHVVGTKTYGGWDPLMRNCDADQLAHKDGGTFPFDMYYPATQAGAEDESSAEVEFQCCTDSMSGTMPNNPVCPPAT